MKNIPDIKLGVVAVSRDCFPLELSKRRCAAVMAELKQLHVQAEEISVVVENENDVLKALDELKAKGCNALVVYLGNFGPEGPETMLAQRFAGPSMFVAASEESGNELINGRGDAYCGMLNASYSLKLRGIRAYIPEYPVGSASEVAEMIAEFVPVARIIVGVKQLKIMTFGPRPFDFLACNAPIEPLYRMGVEVQENSELDLFSSYRLHENDARIAGVIKDMEQELGSGNKISSLLPKLAQYEITLLDWVNANKGASQYAVLANKCWPAFQTEFHFVPCYVNSRFASRLMPIACEVDIYGALSEYMICCATGSAPTILDINNTVPSDLYNQDIAGKFDYTNRDLFMGFHCGNTPACAISSPEMKYQLIMKRCLEPDCEPNICRGTLEGDIKPGEITFFRVQSSGDACLRSYIAEGEILPVATRSFGSIAIFGIKEMARFYRHVLIGKNYPHHGGVAFGKAGKALYSAVQMLGINEIDFNQPRGMMYKDENPFA